MLLALETSTNVCSVAFKDEQREVYEKRIEKRGAHSEKLFLFIEELMAKHDFSIPELEAVLVSEGPGSYTGLRISASAVKGLLFQTKVPLFAINTLASFAMQAFEEKPSSQAVHSVIDARRVHLYHQSFEVGPGGLAASSEVEVKPIEQVQELLEAGDAVIGTGIDRIEASARGGVSVLGAGHITARSLVGLYGETGNPFIRRVDPELYDPKYYTSRQAEN